MISTMMQAPLQPLQALIERGLQPRCRMIWLGLDFLPPKQNAIEIHSNALPSTAACAILRGLDVIVLFDGQFTSYGVLRQFCSALYAASPRRLQVHDLHFGKAAFLRLGGGA
jgi:hypothetical protein